MYRRLLTLFIFCLFLTAPQFALSKSKFNEARLLKRIQGIINKHYHGVKITGKQLEEGAATGMVEMLNNLEFEQKKKSFKTNTYTDAELKEHTFNLLMKPSDYRLLRELIAGKFSGIGAIIKKDKDAKFITITRLLEGSGAQAAGIKKNDRITAIDNREVERLSLKDCVTMLRGVTGTRLRLRATRTTGSNSIELDFLVTRRPVSIPDIESKIINSEYGYILIRSFSYSTSILLAKAITTIKKAGLNKLIIDLRDNPGGEFTAAIKAADLFLPRDTLIVTTSHKHRKRKWKATRGRFWKGTLVCLINSRTASAAEILAGAIKSSATGILAGQPTFGKDSVQTVFKLPDSYGLKLTTSRLILTGCEKDGSRIQPHVYLEKSGEELVTSYGHVQEVIESEIETDDAIKSACGILKYMKHR